MDCDDMQSLAGSLSDQSNVGCVNATQPTHNHENEASKELNKADGIFTLTEEQTTALKAFIETKGLCCKKIVCKKKLKSSVRPVSLL